MAMDKSKKYYDFLAALVACNFAEDEMSKALYAKNATAREMRAAYEIVQDRRAAYRAIYAA